MKKIRRLKFGWCYSPDLIEDYLEKMELKGYNLVKVGFLGYIFTFVKGTPKHVRYCTDCHSETTAGYYELYRDDNWKLVYSFDDTLTTRYIWGKEYNPNEEKPNIYTDHNIKYNLARKFFIRYSAFLIPLILISIRLVQSDINSGPDAYIIIPILMLLEYLFLYYRVTSYFFRIRKNSITD
ncbi:DUF2812 domain-containing protein [Clostridium gasigenes]|uniref:DUF2812 domain-containing protein n=1 Tax=Clostridium gasigenes TaxID=94869 RepID=A0A7X0SA36_9CLOT|nr:DUF2812 domain-containing protein [Clostridium gasigenes]MBB6713848.1 DUF2812 domain-containing protein [Clostridium gasigenes]